MARGDGPAAVDLGFVDDCDEPLLLHSAFFPSKVGGHPAWLSPEGDAPATGVRCGRCGGPTRFLLQLYTGGNWPQPDAFHRTVMLFACGTPACYQGGDGPAPHVRALRAQLPRANAFYPEVPPDDADPAGTVARCAEALREPRPADQPLEPFPELALVIDGEPEEAAAVGRSKKDAEAAEAEEAAAAAAAADGAAGDEIGELPAPGGRRRGVDGTFARFKARVAPEPTQVVRYSKGGEPLWIGPGHEGAAAPPPCERCGGPRAFEFQVMPQLLAELGVDSGAEPDAESVDWGVLAVYTCAASCAVGTDNVEEWVFSNVCAGDDAGDDDDEDSDDGSEYN